MIDGHKMVINLKPDIDRALEQQKLEQANKSYDKTNLTNRTDALSRQVYPQRDYRELDTEEKGRGIHNIRLELNFPCLYENVNEFASLIRQESPYMFLSK